MYCMSHLLTSLTAKGPGSLNMTMRKTSLLIHPTELQILPWSVAIGHFVPIAFSFYFPTESSQSIYKSQQFWLVARLFHPIFTSITHLLLSIFWSRGSEYTNKAQRNREVLRHLQSVYMFAMSLAALLHIGTLTLAVTSLMSTSIFTPAYKAAFDPMTVFRPAYFWESGAKTQVVNLATGALYVLQWDVSYRS